MSKHLPIKILKGNRETNKTQTFLTPDFRGVDAAPVALPTSAAEGAGRILRVPEKISTAGLSGVTAICTERALHTSII